LEFDTTQITPAGDPTEQRLFLNLENVRGEAPSGVLDIYVSVPGAGAVPASTPQHVETIALFGLAKASSTEGAHAGNGLSVAIDITNLIRNLAVDLQTALERLEVRIVQPGGAERPITVERISVYRQPVE
jgi:tyrosinase